MAIKLYDLFRLNFAIYPGIRSYRAATFLRPYYEQWRSAGLLRQLLNLLLFGIFHLWLPIRARLVARRWGQDDAWTRRTLSICRARFVDPNDVALFRISDASELDHYMRRFEHIGVGRAIAQPDTDHSELMLDKGCFYALCRSHGIAHPPVLATHERGMTRIATLPESGQEIFVKPARGSGGRGAVTLVFNPGGNPEAELRSLLAAQERRARGGWIVQPRLRSHQALRDIAGNALPTVRVVTLINERQQPEVVSTVVRLAASQDAIVDNIGVGGLSAPVDAESGLLGPACGGMQAGEFSTHPLTDAPIEGRGVPHWSSVVELALSTHAQHFADHVMIGWDVALAEDGPCLLEANARPSIIMTQRAARTPVGRTRMGELIEFHLERRYREGFPQRRLLVG